MKRLIAIILVSLLLCMQGCEKPSEKVPDVIEKARTNFINGYYAESEKGFERYIQDNPQGKYRLEAWQYLVKIVSQVRNDTESGAEILEAMYLEFGHSKDLAASIKRQLGELYIRSRRMKLAVEALEKSLEFTGQPQKQIDSTRFLLAETYRSLRNYDLAIYTYGEILESTKDIKSKAEAAYEMANTLTLIQDWERAGSELEHLIRLEGVPDDIHAEAVFLLADIYEHNHKYKQALKMLETIVDTYPNPYAVQYKIDYLKEKK